MPISTNTSALGLDFNDIIERPRNYKPYFLINTILHTENNDLRITDGVFIADLVVVRDYINRTSDYMEIKLFCPPGTYVYDIYPYADDLELTLMIYKQTRNGLETYLREVTYKAMFLMEKNMDLPNRPDGPREMMNRGSDFVLTLELVDKGSMAVRNKTTQGVYSNIVSDVNKDMSPSAILKSILSSVSRKVQMDNKPVLDKINIEESPNQTPLNCLIVPTGTGALEVANFVQDKGGGLYPSGSNNYIQHYSETQNAEPDRTLFVYSLYDGDKFDNAENKILFYVPPDDTLSNVAKTYELSANVLKILTNPITGLNSTKDTVMRSEGEGFRSASADAVFKNGLDLTKDGPRFKKTGVLSEITSKIREDGMTFLPYKGISSNHFVNASEILSRKGEYIVIPVDNLDMDYYYPGAACKVIYEMGNGLIVELVGVIHKAEVKFNYPTFDPTGDKNRELHALTTKTFFTVYITGPDSQ